LKPDLRHYLGTTVHIIVDRPLHSSHPSDPGFIYPINYGYIPNTLSGDGHPVDAYIVGVNRPLVSFTGTVVAVAIRHNDAEDKLVVAPPGVTFSPEEIARFIHFQERYFNTSILVSTPDAG
jgi:inorganic pyrophosphatase